MTTREDFNLRKSEIKEYLRIIETLDAPESAVTIMRFAPTQRNILHSVTFLLLYNLVESTIKNNIHEYERQLSGKRFSNIRSLSETDSIRNRWIDLAADTYGVCLNEAERIRKVRELLTALADNSILELKYHLRQQGNIDDRGIESIAKNLDIELPSLEIQKKSW